MRLAVLFAATLAVAACETPYREPTTWSPLGVAAYQIADDTFRVEAQVNSTSSVGLVEDYLLLKSAETALRFGAAGFVVTDKQDNTRKTTRTVPGKANTETVSAVENGKVVEKTITTYEPPTTTTSIQPGEIWRIRLADGPSDPSYRDAEEILRVIGPRVKR